MEILQVLLSLLAKAESSGKLEPIINLFKDNSFDLKRVLSNLNLETLLPIFSKLFSEQKNSPTDSVGRGEGLNPIAKIADKDIVYTLNRYFHEPI